MRNHLPLALLCASLLGARAPDGVVALDAQALSALSTARQTAAQAFQPGQEPRLTLAPLVDNSIQTVERARFSPEALAHFVRRTAEGLKAEPVSVQHRCLSEAVYFEARGEPVIGQLAVAQVILNRVRSRQFPKTVCEVVYEVRPEALRCQFSYACDGVPDIIGNRTAWRQAQAVALIAASGSWRDVTGEATHFHARYVSPDWAGVIPQTQAFGRHVFYREGR